MLLRTSALSRRYGVPCAICCTREQTDAFPVCRCVAKIALSSGLHVFSMLISHHLALGRAVRRVLDAESVSFPEIFLFVSDRLRSIRQEYSLQGDAGEDCVRSLEEIARFCAYARMLYGRPTNPYQCADICIALALQTCRPSLAATGVRHTTRCTPNPPVALLTASYAGTDILSYYLLRDDPHTLDPMLCLQQLGEALQSLAYLCTGAMQPCL